MTAIVLHGDAAALPLPDASVDLIVTSPPYWTLRSYRDGGEHYAGQIGAEPTPAQYVDSLITCTREWMRVLKPTGSLWVNLGDKYSGSPSGPRKLNEDGWERDRSHSVTRQPPRRHSVPAKSLIGLPWRYALRCIDDLGLSLRAEVVWSKTNGLPESVTDRVRRSHEQWFHFVLQPRYYAAVDSIRERYAPETAARYASGYKSNSRAAAGQQSTPSVPVGVDGLRTNPLGKLPGSVWSLPSEPLRVPEELGIDHFAAFPTALPLRIIAGWSPPTVRAVVLDPFGGTGTTALVASVLGRVGISVDKSLDYCRLAAWRTNDPKQRDKVATKTRAAVQPAATTFDSLEAV